MPLPTDPLLNSQWHLGNTGGLLDLNVRGVWSPASGSAYTGAGIRVVIIDDGFDYTHSDLSPNYNTSLDFDFDGSDPDPFGTGSDSHGTAVTGIIGADNNGTGAVGVAFDSSLVGYRVHGLISDFWLQNIRDAIHHAAVSAQGDVVNISQGIANDADSEFGVGYNAARFDEIEASIGTAVSSGRGGLGMTIVKSAGNSRGDNYDINADDWTNDTRQVVVAAVDQNGFISSYSSYGAALLISAFGTPGQVVTTDRVGAAGYDTDDFTETFNGTSAAAPMVAGVVSLIYDANPNLGWRDVQSILANSARHVGSNIDGFSLAGSERYFWQWNAANTWNGGGLHFSNDYGYGLVDALAAVRLAETWLIGGTAQTSGNEFTNTMDMLNSTVVIPDGNATGLTFTGSATFNDVVERVTVRVTFSTTFTGDVELYLTSPHGTVSELIDDTGGTTNFDGTWTFETQAFRGERAAGTWTVRIVDDAGQDVLSLSDIVVTTFGVSSADDRYIFTNEYSDYASVAGHATAISDTNGGSDTVNAAAVSTGSTIRLDGISGSIDGVAVSFLNIENAIGGSGSDFIFGNSANNTIYGGGGTDTINGGAGWDRTIVNFASTAATISQNSSTLAWTISGAGQTEILTNVEVIQFSNGVTRALRERPRSDFDGNNCTDILWRNTSTGAIVQWTMNGLSVTGGGSLGGDSIWSVIGTGDFNGDGNGDLLWRNGSNGVVVEHQMSGSTVLGGGSLGGNLDWSIAGTGDFNGDGRTDLLWRSASTGTVVQWQMNGTTVSGTGTLGGSTAWSIAGTGDFNGDGRSDILWRNNSTGGITEWLMNGTTSIGGGFLGGDGTWSIVGTGDFNGNGTTDLLWRNGVSGAVVQWQMNGTSISGGGFLGGDLNWSVAGTGDHNGDGRCDLLWRDAASGSTVAWFMNGTTLLGSGAIGGSTNWSVVA